MCASPGSKTTQLLQCVLDAVLQSVSASSRHRADRRRIRSDGADAEADPYTLGGDGEADPFADDNDPTWGDGVPSFEEEEAMMMGGGGGLPRLSARGAATGGDEASPEKPAKHPRELSAPLPADDVLRALHFVLSSADAQMQSQSLYRYTEWLQWNGSALRPMLHAGAVLAVELYNHTDPLPSETSVFDAFENVNLARQADPALLQNLSAKLRGSFGLV